MSGQSGTFGAGTPLPTGFFEQVVAVVGHAVICAGAGGEVLYWNSAAENLYGYRADEALGRSIVDLILPASERARAREWVATPLSERGSGDWEVQHRSGRVFTVQVLFTELLDDEGRTLGFFSVSSDVTDRRGAERDARQLAAIVTGSADAIIQTDAAGLIQSANAAVGTIFGHDPPSLVGRSAALFVCADQEDTMAAAAACVWAGGSPDIVLLKSPRSDGVLIDTALTLSAVHDDTGRVVGMSGISRDVTQQTRLQTALVASERRFRQRFDQTGVPQAMMTLDGTLLAVNDAFCLLSGRERAELEGIHARAMRHPDGARAAPDQLAAILDQVVDETTYETAFIGQDGAAIPVMIHAALLRDADGTPNSVAVFVQDLTLLRRAERALTQREALHEALGRQAGEWAMVIDAGAVMRYVSPALTGAMGYPPESLTGRLALGIVHPDDQADLQRTFERIAIRAGVSETAVFRVVDAAGCWRWVENVFTNYLADPAIAGFVATGRDVTARVEEREELRRRALRDELTGLANRTLLGDRLEQALARSARDGDSPVAVLFAGLDQFKLINDSWGHAAGDQFLVQVADRLSRAVRASDTVARFGGDEFVVICEYTDSAAAVAVAARVQAALADPFEFDGRRVYVQASIGIAVSPPYHGPDLLRFADTAMYAAKSAGRSRVQVFDMALADDAADRLTLGSDLRDALARDELTLHYQPVVELATGSLLGLEALARWSHPVRGPVSPVLFVAVAEATGLASALNRWVLRRACRDAAVLRELLPVVPRIAVNISARHLVGAELEAEVLAAVSDGGLGAQGLMLEITESALMDEPDQTRQLLQRLQALGVPTAIDDFGTGYSSLAYLQQLPVTTLKIDRSFVKNITNDPDSLAITASVLGLAHAMHLDTIAEGIETVEQLVLLRDLGCHTAQGFLWSQGLSPEALAGKINDLPNQRFDVGLNAATPVPPVAVSSEASSEARQVAVG